MKLKDYLKEHKIKAWEDFEAPLYESMDVANRNVEPDNKMMNRTLTFLKTICDPLQEEDVYKALAAWDVPDEVITNVLGVSHCNLGAMYYTGNGVGQDYHKAQDHYEHGFRLGDSQAACNLGYCYVYERAGIKDDARAFECFAYAAANLNINGTYKLGDCYDNGTHVARDPYKAFAIYNAAESLAERMDDPTFTAEIAYRIACKYDTGDGVSRNLHEAYNYYEQAANAAEKRAEAGDVTVDKLLADCNKRLAELRDDPEFVIVIHKK